MMYFVCVCAHALECMCKHSVEPCTVPAKSSAVLSIWVCCDMVEGCGKCDRVTAVRGAHDGDVIQEEVEAPGPVLEEFIDPL